MPFTKKRLLGKHPVKGIRWWPVLLIAVLSLLIVAVIWAPDASHRQQQVMQTTSLLVVTLLLLVLWLLLFSRLSLKVRLVSFAAVILFLGLSAALFRIGGVSGDLVPIPEWRWTSRGHPSVTEHTLQPGDQISGAATGSPSDYPQFLGSGRNATLPGVRLMSDWSNHPPRLVWRQPVGAGWSAFAVAGQVAVTQEQHGEQEQVVCYDLKSGRVRWRHSDTARYESTIAGVGPRATPTIVKDRVYTFGATGILNCLDLASGRKVWSKDTLKENGAKINTWGMSCSPLVLDSLAIVSPGGPDNRSLVAYHKDTGRFIWGGGNSPAGYSSPGLATLAGIDQVLIFNRGSVAAHDPLTGQVLWQHPWPGSGSTQHVAQPVPLPGSRVFVSTGYGIGCKLFQISRDGQNGFNVSLVWETPRLKAKFTNVVHRDGYIYGLDDGVLVCLDLANGRRRWKRGRYGHGQLMMVGDLLLIQAESGDVVLVDVNPDEFKERARLSALNSKTWNNPALAGRYLLVRNDREAACYELPRVAN